MDLFNGKLLPDIADSIIKFDVLPEEQEKINN